MGNEFLSFSFKNGLIYPGTLTQLETVSSLCTRGILMGVILSGNLAGLNLTPCNLLFLTTMLKRSVLNCLNGMTNFAIGAYIGNPLEIQSKHYTVEVGQPITR